MGVKKSSWGRSYNMRWGPEKKHQFILTKIAGFLEEDWRRGADILQKHLRTHAWWPLEFVHHTKCMMVDVKKVKDHQKRSSTKKRGRKNRKGGLVWMGRGGSYLNIKLGSDHYPILF